MKRTTHFIKEIQLSAIAIAVVVIACLAMDLKLKNFEKESRVIEWDIRSYYAYLPAQFIYHDIRFERGPYTLSRTYYMFWPLRTSEGKNVIKTSLGLAILYSPFFFVAHEFATLSNYTDNGFSEPYKLFLLLSAVFYLFVGLEFLRKTLRHFNFSDRITAITILLIGLGTNLFAYSSESAPMSHVYSFCLFSAFVYFTIRWHLAQTIKNSLTVGALLGLISLVRPNNIVIILFFMFYDVGNFNDLKQKTLLFARKILFILLMIIPFATVWLPQLIYWRYVTGHYIYYSYNDERFFFNDPKIFEGLFSFQKGWLIYTPMMIFALIGIFFMKDSLKKLRIPITLFFLINIYITFSWWSWWYGGSFGQRPLIDGYALFALPLTSFIKYVGEKKLFYKVSFYTVAIFFVWLNLFQTWQFEYFVLHWDGMTAQLYFKQFGKIKPIKDFDSYVISPDYEGAKNGKRSNFIKQEKVDDPHVESKYMNRKEQSRIYMHLKAMNNKYVSADDGLSDILIADKEKASTWERFVLILYENNECVLESHKDRFCSAELNQDNKITATRQIAKEWETFVIIRLENNFVAFQAANGKYLSVDEESSRLFAKSDFIGRNEKFSLITE